MRNERSAKVLAAQILITGAIATTLVAVTPDVYYDMRPAPAAHVVDVSATTPNVTPDVYYDM